MHFLTEIDDDVILLEWDIVVAHHDLFNFVAHCRDMPNRLQVAPYILYNSSLEGLTAPVWAHRHMVREMPLQLSWIEYGDTVCDLFSTGMIYIPKEIIKRLDEADELVRWHNNLNDSKFAFWHYYKMVKRFLFIGTLDLSICIIPSFLRRERYQSLWMIHSKLQYRFQ
jgi:hypothetical protein